MVSYPHKPHHKLSLAGITRNELILYSRKILEVSETPLTTKQIADLIQQKQGSIVNLRILGHVLSKNIPMIQKHRKRIEGGGAVTLYSLPPLLNVAEAKE